MGLKDNQRMTRTIFGRPHIVVIRNLGAPSRYQILFFRESVQL